VPSSVNSRLLNKTLQHEVGLRRVEARTVREVIRLLNEADRDLMQQLEARLVRAASKGLDPGPATTRRMDAVLQEIRVLNKASYDRLGYFLRKELQAIGEYELDFQEKALTDSIGADVIKDGEVAGIAIKRGALQATFVRPPLSQIVAAIEHQPLAGDLMKDWVSKLSEDKIVRIRQALNNGIIQGQSVEQMVRRLRGTKAAGYADGILDIPRRHAETWVRTSVGHVANFARDDMYKANEDVLSAVIWTGTLDSRTCPACVARDGRRYSVADHQPIGHSIPWLAGPGRLHAGDRCTSRPEVRTWRELGLDIDQGPPGMRAAFGGPVSAKVTAEDWLRDHPDSARRLYGKTRSELFLKGGLSAEDLINKDGELWTLEELKEREAAAFAKIKAVA
jgi:SPP1 gp7 family putative phage head morphogenesis protein